MAEKSLLSKLPPAVRRKVFRYLVAGAHILLTQSWKKVHTKYHEKYPENREWEDPLDTSRIEADEWPDHLDNRILRTSHQINDEASALLFQESTFWVTYHISDLNRGLKDLDIGDLEANLHRIGDLTICIQEEDDEPVYETEDFLPQLGEHAVEPKQKEERKEKGKGKGKKKKEKTARGISQLLERYAARCTALRKLTVRFEFEEAWRRHREPQSKWRPMLERILRSSPISRALASFAVRDEVVIKTNIMLEPLYTEEICTYVEGVAMWKGWKANMEKGKFDGGFDLSEGPTEKWVLRPKTEEEKEREEKSKVRIDDEFVQEFAKKQKELREKALE